MKTKNLPFKVSILIVYQMYNKFFKTTFFQIFNQFFNGLVRKSVFSTKLNAVGLVTKSVLNAKITEIRNKMPENAVRYSVLGTIRCQNFEI